MHQYYQEIIKKIGDADQILVFGPGEARIEFKKEMQKSKILASKTRTIEPADKMTDNQIVAKLKDYFHVK